MSAKVSSCDGDQFELDLFVGEPWGGHSPRGLTRARSGLFLRQEPPGHEVEADPAQLVLWPGSVRPSCEKKPQQAAGASSLLPLIARRVFRRARRGSSGGYDCGDT